MMISKSSLFPAMICCSFILVVNGCGGATGGSTASGGSTTPGTGGSGTTGSGGSSTSSSGGSTASGSGGNNTSGSGGNSTTGSGGSSATGSGGRGSGGSGTGTGGGAAMGTGGGNATGTGGGSATGTGGSTSTGSGGSTAATNEFWISPSGKDTNPGTKEAPLFTLCDDDLKTGACYKICPVGGGCMPGPATIWAMDGVYKYGAVTQKIGSTKLATAAAPYRVFAVAGATPIFDFTGQAVNKDSRGIQLQGDYWHIKGITVTKAGDSGIFIMGNHNTIEQCVTHHNNDTGIMVGVNSSRAGTGTNNLILNCDSYQNADPATEGANSDGFGAKENTGAGNVFDGCRAWDNADDGFDFYAWASPVTVKNSWAFNQGATYSGAESNGNGFKMGGNKVSAVHVMSNLFAFDNNGDGGHKADWGFTNNSNPASMTCTGCGAWNNTGGSFQGIAHTGDVMPTGVTAAKAAAAKRNADGSLPDITKL